MGNYIMAVCEVLCIDIKHLYYIEWSTQMDDMAKIDILLKLLLSCSRYKVKLCCAICVAFVHRFENCHTNIFVILQ